jgi:hypothetical protein
MSQQENAEISMVSPPKIMFLGAVAGYVSLYSGYSFTTSSILFSGLMALGIGMLAYEYKQN